MPKRKAPAALDRSRHVLVTGVPSFVVTHLVWRLLEHEPETRITILVRNDQTEAGPEAIADGGDISPRVEVVASRIVVPGLGLTSEVRSRLQSEVTDVYHFASLYHIGVDKRRAEDVNIQSTRNVLAFARTLRGLVRFNHYSTVFVSGSRDGIILEDELDRGQTFRNTYERTKFTAELEVRRCMGELPISVFRTGLIVGDSRSGRIEPLDGPYLLVALVANSPGRLPLRIPSAANHPFNVVPVDFVAEAIHALSLLPWSEGRTFHIVDPNPIPTEEAFRLIAEHANRGNAPPAFHGWFRRRLLSVGPIERWMRSSKAYLHELDRMTFYNSANTLQGLRDTAILCPSFPSYVERLVGHVRRRSE